MTSQGPYIRKKGKMENRKNGKKRKNGKSGKNWKNPFPIACIG
jgi:hypothetical protein